MQRSEIRDFYGRIQGYIDTEPNGDKTVRDFYGKIQGYYKKDRNVTTNFYGLVIAKGDTTSGLIKF